MRKIAICDDEPYIREMLCNYLSRLQEKTNRQFLVTCYIIYIRNIKGLNLKLSAYYSLICMIIFTANTNIWQTPYLYPVSRSLLVFSNIWYLNVLICSIIEYTVCFLLFFSVKHLVKLNEIPEVRSHRFAMIFVIIFCQSYVKSSLKLLNEKNTAPAIEMSAYTIFLQLVLIALFIIYERYLYSRRIQEITSLQEISSLYQLKALQMQQRNEQDLKQLNHDMKNHLLAINNYCQNGNVIQASDYIHSLLDQYISGEAIIETGNDLLNGLLTQKLLEAKKNQIEITVIMDGRPISYIKDIDLCTIFGNLLDNAMEACLKVLDPANRFIIIKGGKVNEQYFLCITNSYTDPVRIANELPLTSKADRKLHGYGLNNVLDTIKRYGGTITFDFAEHQTFKLTVMLPLEY